MVELLIQVGNTTKGTARIIKGTVSVLSSDPKCKDDNPLFITVFLKHLSDQGRIQDLSEGGARFFYEQKIQILIIPL